MSLVTGDSLNGYGGLMDGLHTRKVITPLSNPFPSADGGDMTIVRTRSRSATIVTEVARNATILLARSRQAIVVFAVSVAKTIVRVVTRG